MAENILFEQLKHSPIFARLDTFMFQTVEAKLVFQKLEAGEMLFNEGEHGDYMAFVLLGELVALKTNPDGSTIQIGSVKAGDSTGEMALIDALTRSASVKAVQLTALVRLSKTDFEMLLTDYPRIGVEMLRGLATMLSLKFRRTSENLTRSNS